MYKRRKSKISKLVRNKYGTRDCLYEALEGIHKRSLDTNINHFYRRHNFTGINLDNNVSFSNSSSSVPITDLQSNFHDICSNLSPSTIERVCVNPESWQTNRDNSSTSIRNDSDRAESKPSKKPRRFDLKRRKRKHRIHGLNISTAHHSPFNFTDTTVLRVLLVCLRGDRPLFLLSSAEVPNFRERSKW